MEIIFRPDPTIWDGRFANNGWLQELPKPITKLTWDNAALISPGTAKKLNLKLVGDNGRIAEVQYKGRTLKIPVYLVPGQATTRWSSTSVTVGPRPARSAQGPGSTPTRSGPRTPPGAGLAPRSR